MMKKMILTAMTASMIAACNTEKKPADDGLVFDASVKTQAELTMPDGAVIKYDAYEKLYYVKNVEDSTYQYMNIYVPEGAGVYLMRVTNGKAVKVQKIVVR